MAGECTCIISPLNLNIREEGWVPDWEMRRLNTLKKEGRQIKLEVHKENMIAKRLYKKLGFFAYTNYDIFMIRDIQGNSWHENS